MSHSNNTNFTTLSKDMLFTEFLDWWLIDLKNSISQSTFSGYRNCIRVIKRFFEELELSLCKVKPFHIQEFYRVRMMEGVKAITILHYHANIHKAFKRAMQLDLVEINPSDKVILPKKETFHASYYSEDELKKLFQVIIGDECELCIHIAAFYGLRRSEIIGLKWDAIDFIQKTISVKNKITEAHNLNGKYELVIEKSLKNKSSYRTFPLISHIEKMLLIEKSKQNFDIDDFFADYVCKKKDGKLIRPNYLSEHFDYILAKHNLRKIRLHDLRHTCASLMLKHGISMKQIQEWLGHSNFATTANIYSHLDYSSKITSAEKINEILDFSAEKKDV